MISSRWPSVRLEETCVRVTDGTHQSPRFEAHGIPFLVISDVVSGEIDWSGVSKWVNEETYEANTSRCRPERGDVLYTAVGSFGVAVPVETDQRFMFQRHIAHIKPDPRRVHTRFLAHILNSPAIRAIAERVAKGVAQRTVTLGDLKNFEIPLPSLSEQRRIADILDKADAIRRKRKEAIALTESLLRSTFLEMFGDPVKNPKGWELKALATLLAMPLRNGLSPASGGAHPANVLTLSAITRGRFDGTAVKQGVFDMEPSNDVRLDARDFLICRGNGNLAMVGSGAFPGSSDPTVVFPDTMIAARVNEELISLAFLATMWKSALVRRQIEAGARTTNGTFKVNQTLIESVEIPLPGLRKQQAFAAVAQRISNLAERHGKIAENAHELFDVLVQRAFSGGLRS